LEPQYHTIPGTLEGHAREEACDRCIVLTDLLQELRWCQHSAYAQVLPAQPEGRLDKPLICLGLKLQDRQHTSNIPCVKGFRPWGNSWIAGICASPVLLLLCEPSANLL
jgi:hypothetical protein